MASRLRLTSALSCCIIATGFVIRVFGDSATTCSKEQWLKSRTVRVRLVVAGGGRSSVGGKDWEKRILRQRAPQV